MAPYRGSIHDHGKSPFFTYYGTIEQINHYKSYLKNLGDSAFLTIDASGSVVSKIKQTTGEISAHIYLYLMVIHFDTTSLPIWQMLSESQESEKILHWMRVFLREVNFKKPPTIVIDYSPALLSACCLAFNDINTKRYISICFQYVSQNQQVPEESISTFIRIDVAHMIHLVCRWKCFRDTHPTHRDFYIRCVGLMIDCQNYHDFLKIFKLTCICALQLDQEKVINSTIEENTGAKALKTLREYMILKPLDDNLYLKLPTEGELVDTDYNPVEKIDEDVQADICTVFENIKKESESVLVAGSSFNPNFYHNPHFIDHLLIKAKQFPLWTAVCMRNYSNHASSSCVERAFGYIKHGVFKNFKLPLSADNSIKHHIKSLLGAALSAESNIQDFIEQENALSIPIPKVTTMESKIIKTIPKIKSIISVPKVTTMESKTIKTIPKIKSIQIPEVTTMGLDLKDPKIIKTIPKIKNPSFFNDSGLCEQENWMNKATLPSRTKCIDPDESIDEIKQSDIQHNTSDITEKSWQSDHNYSAQINFNDSSNISPTKYIDPDESIDKINQSDIQHNTSDIVEKSWQSDHNYSAQIKFDDSSNIQDNLSPKRNETFIGSKPQPGCHSDNNVLSSQSKPFAINIPSSALYFRNKPELAFQKIDQNSLAHSKKYKIKGLKKMVLINGTSTGAIKIGGIYFVGRLTCAFDSVAHVLFSTAVDDSNYYSMLDGSKESNRFCEFMIKYINTSGVFTELYESRFWLLKPFHENNKVKQYADDLTLTVTYNFESSPADIWWNLMGNILPSATCTYNCNFCEEENFYCDVTFRVNHKVIVEKGFGVLQSAVRWSENYDGVCHCGQPFSQAKVTNFHIFIELAIQKTIQSDLEKCKLKDIPATLNFQTDVYRFV